MSKITMNRAQFELAKRLGMVKIEDGKMFLMPTAVSKEVWNGAVPTMPIVKPTYSTRGGLYDNTIIPAPPPPPPLYSEKYTLDDLRGKTFDRVYVTDDKAELIFENAEYEFKFYHDQDCCECVQIEDVVGDLSDLVGKPLDIVEEVEYDSDFTPEGVTPPSDPESYTWTFYKFATIKGYVDVRWLGESNSYYSESVDFVGRKK